MINNESYSKEWIYNLRKSHKKIDPAICEKMIRALGLLESLALGGLDFVFRGGTSLILLIEEPQRFSIDIDINSEDGAEKIVSVLGEICNKGLFSGYIEDIRKNSSIPKSHFKLYFNSAVSGKEDYVLLDVLSEGNPYPKITETKILSKWISTDGEIIKVKTPTIDSILGDKLTAFAPNTTGVPYKKGKSMEIIKQLFDIGRLFDLHSDLIAVSGAFNRIAERQIYYRGMKIKPNDVLDDIIKTSLAVSFLPPGKPDEYAEITELFDGIKKFTTFPIGQAYRADDAILSASKAAYLAVKIKNNDLSKIFLYSEKLPLKDVELPKEYKHIYKMKKNKIEAYYYWTKFFENILR